MKYINKLTDEEIIEYYKVFLKRKLLHLCVQMKHSTSKLHLSKKVCLLFLKNL